MPELPEVETIRRRLSTLLPGKILKLIDKRHPKSFHGATQDVLGLTVKAVSRRAKILYIQLSTGRNLMIHLKMTGQLIFWGEVEGKKQKVGGGHPTSDWIYDLPSSHTRVILTFDDGSRLFFNDMRIFGWIKVMTDDQIEKEFAKLGPDINDPQLTVHYLMEKLARRSIPIKQALMINQIVAGVGNIYASDALNLAKISPFRSANSLTQLEMKRLLSATQEVIEEGIKLGGTTFDGKYVNLEGLAGGYQDHLLAYGRQGESCFNCGGTISKAKLGGRGTYFCPDCQL